VAGLSEVGHGTGPVRGSSFTLLVHDPQVVARPSPSSAAGPLQEPQRLAEIARHILPGAVHPRQVGAPVLVASRAALLQEGQRLGGVTWDRPTDVIMGARVDTVLRLPRLAASAVERDQLRAARPISAQITGPLQ